MNVHTNSVVVANTGFCFLVMMAQALLMSPKGRNASMDGLVKLWERAFIICTGVLLLCETTTSFP